MPKSHEGEASVRYLARGLRFTVLVSVAATLIFAPSRLARATTINASSASQSDVAAAIASAADGDVLTIPGGTATWTRTLVVRKAITLQGAGVGSTIIKDAVQKGRLISWTLTAGHLSRLTGIEFQDGGRVNVGAAPEGILHVTGSNTNGSQFRWDHCKWNNLNGFPVLDTVIGVVDHNNITVGSVTNEWIYIYGSNWNGGQFGDGSWAVPANFGSSQFLFVEDNTILGTHPTVQSAIVDAFAGARFVIRYNFIQGVITNHGTESTGRVRSSRAMEIYNNQITCASVNRFIGGNRGGSELYHDNTITQCFGASASKSLGAYRMIFPFPVWGGADGTSQWDVNNGSNPLFSGTAASIGTRSVTVAGAPWRTNQWAGFTIKKTAGGTPGFAYITSNNTNKIDFADAGGFGSDLSFSVGDAFTINKVEQSIDQPGIGMGDLLSGNPPVRPRGWHQVVEPCYMWNNTNDGVPFNNFEVPYSNIKQNINYFNNTAMPGYTPYTYPHPLTKGLPIPEQITRKAAGNSQPKPVEERQPWGGKKIDRKKTKKAKASRTNEMAEGPESLGH